MDARATHGAPNGVSLLFEVAYEDQNVHSTNILDDDSIIILKGRDPYSCRIGFSTSHEEGELGVKAGCGYGSRGVFSFEHYFTCDNVPHSLGDTVAASIKWGVDDDDRPSISYFKNGTLVGAATLKATLHYDQQCCLPHVNIKNIKVRFNFDRDSSIFADKPVMVNSQMKFYRNFIETQPPVCLVLTKVVFSYFKDYQVK